MQLDDFRSNKNLEKTSKNTNSIITSFIKNLENALNNSSSFYSIDRIEGDFAICENRKTLEMVNIPLKTLPKNISINVILKFENGVYLVDTKETRKAKNTISKKSKNLWK